LDHEATAAQGCSFCAIINRKVHTPKIWEDHEFLAFLDCNPVNSGHTLIIPKRHVEYVFAMEDKLYLRMFKIAKELSNPIKNAMHSKRIGIVVEGFGVPHAHIHLVPINKGHELSPSRARTATKRELEQVAEKIKQQIERAHVKT